MRLIESLATTEALTEVFSDNSVLRAMLEFELGLAGVQGRLGVIPQWATDAIVAAVQAEKIDMGALARGTQRAATIGVPLVKALQEQVRSCKPEAAGFVHWGATSQDVADTALVLLLKRARSLLLTDIARIEAVLETIANQHAQTTMLGRTLLQAATPVTFGLKVAGWLGAVRRGRARLQTAFSESLQLQFGGATGTLAALGGRGIEVGAALASELGVGFPDAPWHTHRDRLASLVCACGVLTGSLGKMARDISLLAQTEVAEVSEPSEPGRGGSSTMPHKRNPVGSVITLAAANRLPGLVASFLSGMVQEHERGAGGWQSEWPTIANVIQTTGLAAASMADVVEGLQVDQERMQQNIAATRGMVFAERVMILLGAALGRDVAHKVVEDATRKSAQESKSLAQVLREIPEVTKILSSATLDTLEDPREYLGVADQFRTRLLSQRDGSEE